MHNPVLTTDPEIAGIIENETRRQENGLELIASENVASPAVMAVQGSIFTNKYAEGYPGRRYYGGCACADAAEKLAIDRAGQLFAAEYVNVQPHSGSQANMAALMSMIAPGDTVLGMDLSHGGHLTHGSPVNFSGKLYHFVHYGVSRKTGTIDFDQVSQLAAKHRPRVIIAGASAYPRTIDFNRFAQIAEDCGARLMVDMAHIAGLVAAGLHPSPVTVSDVVTTTTHKTLRGPRGGMILAKARFAAGLNSIIFPGIQGGPLMHVIAAKAVAFKEAMSEIFRVYQQDVVENAAAMARIFEREKINMVSGGTDNHLLLLDLTSLGMTGKDAEVLLEKAGITVNKNAVPFETRSPFVTSGIRIGTPAVTSRGITAHGAATIAALIAHILKHPNDNAVMKQARRAVAEICHAFPLYRQNDQQEFFCR